MLCFLPWPPRGGVQVVGLWWYATRRSSSWRGAGGGLDGAPYVHWRLRLACLSAVSWACCVWLLLLCGSG